MHIAKDTRITSEFLDSLFILNERINGMNWHNISVLSTRTGETDELMDAGRLES
jgi:hypothetical protein